jgi:hypothetical protein
MAALGDVVAALVDPVQRVARDEGDGNSDPAARLRARAVDDVQQDVEAFFPNGRVGMVADAEGS